MGFSEGVCGLDATQSAEPACRAQWRRLPKGHRDVTAPAGTTVHVAIPKQKPGTEGRAPAWLKACTRHLLPLSPIIPFSFMINCNFSQTFNNHYSLPTPPIFACVSMRHVWSWDHMQENRVKMATNAVFVREECFACCLLLNHWKWQAKQEIVLLVQDLNSNKKGQVLQERKNKERHIWTSFYASTFNVRLDAPS